MGLLTHGHPLLCKRRPCGAIALAAARGLHFSSGKGLSSLVKQKHLREAWPLLRGAGLFFEGSLLHRNAGAGENTPLRWGPSHSPENVYLDGNGSSRFLAYNVALDLGVMAHTVRALAAGAAALKTLNELSSSDAELVTRLQKLLQRLPNGGDPMLDADGGLAEWGSNGRDQKSLMSADDGHRHFSHLYPLHPGDGIEPATQPSLAQAARHSLLRRLKNGGGHTGWSAAWASSLWARLYDGGYAHAALRYTLHEFASISLLGLHPKLRGNGDDSSGGRSQVKCMTCVHRIGGPGEGIFQLDANGGYSAAVGEMLLQSHTPSCNVHLLPALPPAWPDGEASGLRARGALTVDMAWSSGRLKTVVVARAPPSTADATIVHPSDKAVSVCCSKRICGSEQPAAVGGAAVRLLGADDAAVWAWQIEVSEGAPWRRPHPRGLDLLDLDDSCHFGHVWAPNRARHLLPI